MLTWNEEANVAACLASLAQQTVGDFEVVLVDAGSTDRTVDVVRRVQPGLPFPLRLHVGPHRMPIGAARNLGVRMARSPRVAFVSADAELEPGWVASALRALDAAHMAFGRQVHAPSRWTVGAAVRGLRYHFPDGPAPDPRRFASNVAAAYRRDVLERHPFDDWTNAAEDLLLARRACAGGCTAAYEPGMVVRHHDVTDWRQELRKNLREGRGCGLYAHELGLQWAVLAWAVLLGLAGAALAVDARLGLPLVVGALWAPAARRGWRRRRAMPARFVLVGVAASPVFDVAYLVQYLRGFLRASLRSLRGRHRRPTHE